MLEFIVKVISAGGSPLELILVVCGIFFVFLAIIGNLVLPRGEFGPKLSNSVRALLGITGALLFSLGLYPFLVTALAKTTTTATLSPTTVPSSTTSTTLVVTTTTTSRSKPMPMQAVNVPDLFYPSGWMGDGEQGLLYLKLNTGSRETFHSAPTSIKVTYQPGPRGWAGIFWQYPDGNWGDKKGRNLKGYTRLVFWAKGERGGEIVEFKTGGIMDSGKPYQDSLEKSIGKITLTNSWKEYIIDLTGEDLSNVIGAFAWVATRDDNPEGLTFYLDDISYQQ